MVSDANYAEKVARHNASAQVASPDAVASPPDALKDKTIARSGVAGQLRQMFNANANSAEAIPITEGSSA